jgi:pimeloyl-ACP methyl ester carboxylesterase
VIEASDLTLVRGDLRVAAHAIRLLRRTLRIIQSSTAPAGRPQDADDGRQRAVEPLLRPAGPSPERLGHRVLAPDLPGYGKTPVPAGASRASAPTVREQAEQLVSWMDAAGIDRAVLFANSVGVQVATEVAVRHPARVQRLVLDRPSPDPAYRAPWSSTRACSATWSSRRRR